MMNMPLFTHFITFKHQQLGFQLFIKCFFGVNSASQLILTTLFLDRLKLRLTKHTSFHQYHMVLTFNQRKVKRQFMTNMNENCFIVCLGNKHELLNGHLDMLPTSLADDWLSTLIFHTDLLNMFVNFIMCWYYLHVF